MQPAVYIVANKPNGTLYIGVTGNLVQRGWQHRSHQVAIIEDAFPPARG